MRTIAENNFKFVIHKHYGELGIPDGEATWAKHFAIVEWGYNNPPRFDIRGWSKDMAMPLKGTTLTLEELRTLKEILNSLDLDNFEMPEKKLVFQIG